MINTQISQILLNPNRLGLRKQVQMTQTPAQRSLQARLAVHARLAREDPVQMTAPARRSLLDRFIKEVDPGGVLSPRERGRRAEHAKKAYFLGLARKSAAARQKKANSTIKRTTNKKERLDG
jgi:hypothetical protein